jgi:hypothetical protein
MPLREAALALALVLLGSTAAAQAIYRCDDGKGGVLYADAPCKGGAKVEVVPGKVDPAAVERLRREERAFAERHAVREAKLQAEAQAAGDAREARARAERQAELDRQQSEYVGYPGYAWGGYWPWPPVPPRPPRLDPPPPSGYLPARPATLPRPRP